MGSLSPVHYLLIILLVVGWYLFARRRNAAQSHRSPPQPQPQPQRQLSAARSPFAAKNSLFLSSDHDLLLHFASMTFVKTALAPLVFWGVVKREDGPRWSLRLRDEAEDDAWDSVPADLGSAIEAAYQRFLRAQDDVTGQDRRWFLNQVREYVGAMHETFSLTGPSGSPKSSEE